VRRYRCGVTVRAAVLRPTLLALAVAAAALAVAACGGSEDTGGAKPPPGVSKKDFAALLADASNSTAADFPAPGGRTLQQVAGLAKAGPQVGFATSVLTTGTDRLAFGVIDEQNNFVYGKSAVYVAPTPESPALGPFPAPADSLVTKPAFRSQNAAVDTSPIAQIYATKVRFTKPGTWSVLAVTQQDTGMIGAAAQVDVKAKSEEKIPAVGQRPPRVSTDTVASAAGNLAAIDTRRPFARELHETNFKDVLGKKPVALLFATPQLCQSRVCGPVVDIALQMKQQYGGRMAFIHEEVYRDNQVSKGLRPQLQAFHLQTEPWLFTINKDGRIAARLEGSFGVNEFRRAIQAALN
jgi:hypothetical protein